MRKASRDYHLPSVSESLIPIRSSFVRIMLNSHLFTGQAQRRLDSKKIFWAVICFGFQGYQVHIFCPKITIRVTPPHAIPKSSKSRKNKKERSTCKPHLSPVSDSLIPKHSSFVRFSLNAYLYYRSGRTNATRKSFPSVICFGVQKCQVYIFCPEIDVRITPLHATPVTSKSQKIKEIKAHREPHLSSVSNSLIPKRLSFVFETYTAHLFSRQA